MWPKLRRLFTPPIFNDEEITRLASVLNTVLWLMVGAILIFIILIIALVPEPWGAIGFFLVFLYPSFAALILMHRQRVKTAIHVFLYSLWVGIAITELITPNSDGNLTSYMIIIVMAGLLLKGRGALIFTILTVLLKMVAIPLNSLIAPELNEFALAGVVGTAITLGIITVLLHVASNSIDNALDRARRNERALNEKVDELRSLSDVLAIARDEALAASKAKSEFLANMSHEIRTPLNAVVGMAELIMDTPLDEQQLDFAGTIRKSSDALLTLINDILDFSKIEANRLELELHPLDLRHCIESAMDIIAPKASNQGLDVAYLVEQDTPGALWGDLTRLRQILVNLLGNGVKFTQAGEVVLTVSAKQVDNIIEQSPNGANDQPWYEWLFSVRDTGIGIAADDMARLFESFSQLDASTTRQYGGTGLGLAISKRLVDMMGGRIWVESELNVGSTFHFTILAQKANYTQPTYLERNLPMLRGKRLLVVDDNATNRKIISLQAQMWGMEVTSVAAGVAALAIIAANEPLDIAILDMSMPHMDGLMLAEKIRAYRDKQSLPLIMLTSIGLRELDERLSHFAAFLTKPIKSAALFDVLAGILSPEASSEQLRSAFTAQSTRTVFHNNMSKRLPFRILLAEDNALNQKMTLLMLERLGYRADVVSNGRDAVDAVQRRPYDVVLMDVQMPIIDGLTATRRIRQAGNNEQLHIIALTADVVENARERCLAAGMDDYISKPVSVADLVLALQRIKKEPLPLSAPAIAISAPAGAPPIPPDDSPVFDPAAIIRMKTMLGSKAAEMLPMLVVDFQHDAQKSLVEMEMAAANQHRDVLERVAHSLKSNSAHFGLMALSACALAIEMEAKSGDIANMNQLLAKTQTAYGEAITILDSHLHE